MSTAGRKPKRGRVDSEKRHMLTTVTIEALDLRDNPETAVAVGRCVQELSRAATHLKMTVKREWLP